MNFNRIPLAIPAALIFAAIALTGCSAGVTKAESAAGTVGRAAKSAALSTSSPSAPPSAALGAATDVKSIHSPGIVAIDEQLAAGQCSAKVVDAATGEYLPDPACTPGSDDPAVTQDNLESTICKSGYTSTVRPPASDTDKVKAESLREYGQTAEKTTEYDHLVSLELGGTNSVSNLWPEPNKSGATGTTNPKDAIETQLNKAVCSHKVTLAAAQKAIAHNWVTAEKDLGL